MVRTRLRDHGSSNIKKPAKAIGKASKGTKKGTKPTARKRAHGEDRAEPEARASPEPKKAKQDQDAHTTQTHDSKPPTSPSNLEEIIAKYGTLPLSDIGLPDPTSPTPSTILALIFHAMLTSARISHSLAYKSLKCLIEAGYHNLDTLSKSTWEERTEGRRADSSTEKIRELVKGIKGIGNVGTDIFCDTAQGVWPCLAPFVDPRSLKTADQCGLGSDVEQL